VKDNLLIIHTLNKIAAEKWAVAGRLLPAIRWTAIVFSLFTFHLLPFTDVCFAEDLNTVLTSDKLEYFSETKKYLATGSVTITREDAVIKADEITYFEGTADVLATGNVRYDDRETSIRAERAEFNIEAKSGRLYSAELFHKKNNYHLLGKIIEKKGEDYYYSPEATFTTCDLPVPEWCFKGNEINAVIGEAIKAKDVSFRIKDLPVFYSPYLWASINTERHTGFLMPGPSYSKTKGAGINIPFFWALSESSDLTIVLDAYSRRGIGAGLEYRFVDLGEVKSNWWLYHIRDTMLHKDFIEVRALHEDRSRENIKGFLNLNYVNAKDFYREYTSFRDVRILRFLESDGELNLPVDNSRVYLLSQYWTDLKNSTGNAPQKLPEIGYVQNYSKIGNVMISASVTAADMLRENGISAGRIDLYPRVMHSFGKDFTISQIVGLRDTFYSFYKNGDEDNTANRTAFEYDVTGHTRLYKDYSFFKHILEPSVRYHFVYTEKNSLPVFDATELYKKTSNFELAILNRGIVSGDEILAVRLAQGIETYNGNRPFLPFRLDAGIKTPAPVTIEATYDFYSKKIETASSEVSLLLFKTNLSFGQRFNRKEEINVYTAGVGFSPSKGLNVAGSLWYDAKGAGLRDVNMTMKYTRQCWSVRLEAVKRPGDFSFKILFDLLGVSSKTGLK
jgi:LPS-assembly protein